MTDTKPRVNRPFSRDILEINVNAQLVGVDAEVSREAFRARPDR
jgi:hypothetical protein